MRKLAFLLLITLGFATTPAFATPAGSDNAADPAYNDGWTTGDNGGTIGTFSLWDLSNNNNNDTDTFAGYFIGSSTSGAGDIDSNGVSFGIYANPSDAYANATRDFASPLDIGDTFSLDISVNFRNGNKGFSLESSGSEIFNLNVGADDYQINGSSLGVDFTSNAIFNLSFTQTSVAGGTYSVVFGSDVFTGSYTGLATGFNLYNSGTENGDNANNLYFNNLVVVPEPSTYALLAGPLLLGAFLFHRRRRALA